MTNVCTFRMDDITPDMDWDKFNQVRELFKRYRIRPLLGVVPVNEDTDLRYNYPREDFWEIIRSLQREGWIIAQHGTNHRYLTKDTGILKINPFSEFAGLPYDVQKEKIQEGRNVLKKAGVESNIFMAPGHTYDKSTVKALVASGFECITDGFYKKPYYSDGLLFVPCRLQGYQKIKGVDTLCLHSNLMSEADLMDLENFCKSNYQNIIPFDIEKMQQIAVKRTWWVILYERWILCVRNGRNKIANSGRLVWYMQYTSDKSSKKKWLKRICYLPLLLFGREK